MRTRSGSSFVARVFTCVGLAFLFFVTAAAAESRRPRHQAPARYDCHTCSLLRLWDTVRTGAVAPLGPRCAAKSFERRCRWRHVTRSGGTFVPDLSRWNGRPLGAGRRASPGSQNFAPLAEASVGNYRFLVALARLERTEGLGSRELGSRLYQPDVLVSALAALRQARYAGDEPAVEVLAPWLRAHWTLLALAAQPRPVTHLTVKIGGATHTSRGNARYYHGPEALLAGERMNVAAVGDSAVPQLLAAALAWPGRSYRRGPFTQGPLSGGLQAGPLSILQALAGKDPLRRDTDPQLYGLTPRQRNTLRQVVRGDPRAARQAFEAWLKPWPVWRDYTLVVRRTVAGTETVFLRSANGNKPAAAYTVLQRSGHATVIIPSRFRSRGANRGYRVELSPTTVTAAATGGGRHTVKRLSGALLWEIELRGSASHTWQDGGTDRARHR